MNPLPDILAAHLAVVFCGINPGLRTAQIGHHFAGRNNRFWPVLHRSGFTPRQLAPEEDRRLLDWGCGLTTVVARPSARADELSRAEFRAAAPLLDAKIAACAPRVVAFLGKQPYAVITARPQVPWGCQDDRFGGAEVWVLPNPSGLNRAFSLAQLVAAYGELHAYVSQGVEKS